MADTTLKAGDRLWYRGDFLQVGELDGPEVLVTHINTEGREGAYTTIAVNVLEQLGKKVPTEVGFLPLKDRLLLPSRHHSSDFGTEQAVVFLALRPQGVRQLLYFFSGKHWVGRGMEEHHGAHLSVYGDFAHRDRSKEKDITEAYPTLRDGKSGIRLSKSLIAQHRSQICEALGIPLCPIEERYVPGRTVVILCDGMEFSHRPGYYESENERKAKEEAKAARRASIERSPEPAGPPLYSDDGPTFTNELGAISRRLDKLEGDRALLMDTLADVLALVQGADARLGKAAMMTAGEGLMFDIAIAQWVSDSVKRKLEEGRNDG